MSRKRRREDDQDLPPSKRGHAPLSQAIQRCSHFCKILVESSLASAIIGKSGSNISNIMEVTGARVKMSDRYQTFPNSSFQIMLIAAETAETLNKCFERVKEEIEKSDASLEVGMAVPTVTAGKIIGKGGATIKSLRDLGENIKITVRDHTNWLSQTVGEQAVVLNGKPSELCDVMQKLYEMVQDDQHEDFYQPWGTKVSYEPMGPQIHKNVGKATANCKNFFKILIDADTARTIIGPKGSTIDEMQKNSGAVVKISNKNEVFPGTKLQICILAAEDKEKFDVGLEALLTIICKEVGDEDKLMGVVVPRSVSGKIIGKGGQRVAELRKEAGANSIVSVDTETNWLTDGLGEQSVKLKASAHGLNEVIKNLSEMVQDECDTGNFSEWGSTWSHKEETNLTDDWGAAAADPWGALAAAATAAAWAADSWGDPWAADYSATADWGAGWGDAWGAAPAAATPKGKGSKGKGKGKGAAWLQSEDGQRFSDLCGQFAAKPSSVEQPMAVSLTLAPEHLELMCGKGQSQKRELERKFNVTITIGDITDQGRRLSITGRASGIYAAHFHAMSNIVNAASGRDYY